MRYISFLFVGVVFTLFACSKSSAPTCDPTPPPIVATEAERNALQTFISSNSINAVQHPSGFFYEIITPGTGSASPTICSNVLVTYIGTIIGGGGTPFDQNLNGTNFPLSNLITGWQLGIPLLKKGGSIRLYLPPSMAYGQSGQGSIPPNSYLQFVVSLLDFQN
jgi:FKBP-type peptidyl-prolyl cis-trans isomerase FkpA